MASSDGAGRDPFSRECVAGKVALVTGGGSGLGLEICKQLGLHGAKICIMGRREEVLREAVDLLQGLGIEAIHSSGDVRKKEDAATAVQVTINSFGQLDILVNAAAGNFLVAAEDLSPNGFRTVLDIDAVGTFTMCLAARPHLARKDKTQTPPQDGGCIINISATLHYTSAWYQAHVMAAKAAVDATTRSLALEWGRDYGIRSNTVAPGPIGNTPGMAKLAPTEIGVDAAEGIPLRRMGDPLDIAWAVLFLASDAGRYINGTNLVVDGGGWLFRDRFIDADTVKAVSRAVERRSRSKDFVKPPRSKL